MHSEKKERRKENKKRLSRETFVFKTVCWCNIAGTLNICLVFTYQNFVIVQMFPYVEIYSLCCLSVELSSFAFFFGFVRLNLFSLNVLFALKTLYGKLEFPTTVNNILS